MMIEWEDWQWLSKENLQQQELQKIQKINCVWIEKNKFNKSSRWIKRGRGALSSLGVIYERWLEMTLVDAMSDYTKKMWMMVKICQRNEWLYEKSYEWGKN